MKSNLIEVSDSDDPYLIIAKFCVNFVAFLSWTK